VISALTIAETGRAILRARVTGRLTTTQERAAVRALGRFGRRYLVGVTDEILDRVTRPFPIEPIRALDAVHLATLDTDALAPPCRQEFTYLYAAWYTSVTCGCDS
jgi:hypothetical protein